MVAEPFLLTVMTEVISRHALSSKLRVRRLRWARSLFMGSD
jgi:hypothetical protein